jgi:hypothetical protein
MQTQVHYIDDTQSEAIGGKLYLERAFDGQATVVLHNNGPMFVARQLYTLRTSPKTAAALIVTDINGTWPYPEYQALTLGLTTLSSERARLGLSPLFVIGLSNNPIPPLDVLDQRVLKTIDSSCYILVADLIKTYLSQTA